MKNNRINLRLLCALSSILLVSNGLQAMTEEVKKNVEKLLTTGSCKNCQLRNANLKRAFMSYFEFQGANLEGANLKEADLRGADLFGANLKNTKLEGANLIAADLRRTDLSRAKLRGANLLGTKLEGADLRGADLANVMKSVVLTDEKIINSGAFLDKNTTLPSGDKYSKGE